MAVNALASNGMNAPVACNEAAQVLPMLSTSGPWPVVVAPRILLSRSGHPMTWRLTLTPVCFWNFASSGPSTAWSACRLEPWLLAQEVNVLLAPHLRGVPLPPPPHAAVAETARTVTTVLIRRAFISSSLDSWWTSDGWHLPLFLPLNAYPVQLSSRRYRTGM